MEDLVLAIIEIIGELFWTCTVDIPKTKIRTKVVIVSVVFWNFHSGCDWSAYHIFAGKCDIGCNYLRHNCCRTDCLVGIYDYSYFEKTTVTL